MKIMMKFTSVGVRAVGLMLVLAAIATTATAGIAVTPAPELDPGSMAGAVALLSGGAVLLMNRLRRK